MDCKELNTVDRVKIFVHSLIGIFGFSFVISIMLHIFKIPQLIIMWVENSISDTANIIVTWLGIIIFIVAAYIIFRLLTYILANIVRIYYLIQDNIIKIYVGGTCTYLPRSSLEKAIMNMEENFTNEKTEKTTQQEED